MAWKLLLTLPLLVPSVAASQNVATLVSQNRSVRAFGSNPSMRASESDSNTASNFDEFRARAESELLFRYPGREGRTETYGIAWATQTSVLVGDSIHADASVGALASTSFGYTYCDAGSFFRIEFLVHTATMYRVHYESMTTGNSADVAVAYSTLRLVTADQSVLDREIRCELFGLPTWRCDAPVVLDSSGTLVPGQYELTIHSEAGVRASVSNGTARSTYMLDLVLSQPLVGVNQETWSAIKQLYR